MLRRRVCGGKLSQERLECLYRFLVSLRGLGQTFLEQQITARFLVPAALAHFAIVSHKARMVAQLEPRQRSIE